MHFIIRLKPVSATDVFFLSLLHLKVSLRSEIAARLINRWHRRIDAVWFMTLFAYMRFAPS
jgi:hypothetical protein